MSDLLDNAKAAARGLSESGPNGECPDCGDDHPTSVCTGTNPLPPTPAQLAAMGADIRTAENAARVRAQTIAVYARQVVDAWPTVFDALDVAAIDKLAIEDDNSGPRAGLHADRLRMVRTALLAYTAAVARLNQALEL